MLGALPSKSSQPVGLHLPRGHSAEGIASEHTFLLTKKALIGDLTPAYPEPVRSLVEDVRSAAGCVAPSRFRIQGGNKTQAAFSREPRKITFFR